MATLYGNASGVVGVSGSADGRIRYVGLAQGWQDDTGSARGTIITGVHVTELGAQIDVSGVVDARLTELGSQIDVERIVPAQLTHLGAQFDVDRIVPAWVTAAGVGLDVDRIVPAQLTAVGAQVDARYRRPLTTTMCWEFHVYTRAGNYLTYLDNAFDKSYLTQLWDVGGGSFRLPADDDKATTTNLKVGNIVKVRYANVDIGAWIMETIATTYVDTGEGAGRIITVSGRGLLGSLQKALVYPTDLGDASTVNRTFSTQTKADIFLTFYDEFVVRGGGLFTTSFTATHDTDSTAWGDSVSLQFKAGQSILDVLRQLQGFGMEVVAQPDKTLDAYVSAGSDLSSSVAFRYGQNVLACSVATQGSDLANVVLGEAQSVLDEDTDATSITTYGRQEAYLPVRNTSSAGDIAAANTQFLTTYKNPPASIALQVACFPDYPLVDYNIGDTVHVTVPDDIDTDYRVLAIAMQENSGPCDLRVTLELNSLEAEYLARLQRAMDASLASVQPGPAAASGLASSTTASNPGSGAFAGIDDLDDVVIASVADNEVLAYDSGTGNWLNQTAVEAGLTAATLTTKGDLLSWDTALNRLAVGTDGHVLTADAAQGIGIKWAQVTAGSVSIADAGGWFTAADVEAALQELGAGYDLRLATQAISAGTTAGTAPVILADATSGTLTLALPAVASSGGIFYHVKKVDGSAYPVIIDGNAAETIDGATTATLASQYDNLHIICDGSEWHKL